MSDRAATRPTGEQHDTAVHTVERIDRGAIVATGIVVATLGAGVVAGRVPAAALVGIGLLVPAAVIDARTRQLPNRWVAAAATGVVVAWVADRLAGGDVPATAVAAGVGLAAGPLLAIHLVSPAAMGFGDVKAAGVLGAALATVDWRLAIVVVAVASAAAAITGLAQRRSTIPFGPFLVGAAWFVVVAAGLGVAGVPS